MAKRFVVIMIFLLFFTFQSVQAQITPSTKVEIFNLKTENIEKEIYMNNKIYSIVCGYLKNISGIYGKVNPIPKDGFAIKIPLIPPIKMQDAYLKSNVCEVIIMYPDNSSPFLMVFDDEYKLMYFTFSNNGKTLLNALKYHKAI